MDAQYACSPRPPSKFTRQGIEQGEALDLDEPSRDTKGNAVLRLVSFDK